jgi:hypothetical protein
MLISRREVLQAAVLGGASAGANAVDARGPGATTTRQDERPSYETHARGIRIFPGQWRPHYAWEHIAWVSPPWPSQDYIWLDFPEAVFTRQGLIYLSHVNPGVQPVAFMDQPAVPWKKVPGGIAYERALPDGIVFGGKITAAADAVDLEIFIRNGSKTSLTDIKLQTCFFLRAIAEFAAYTTDNKFVHVPGRGWVSFPEARKETEEKGQYRLGWRSGPKVADLPVMATLSSKAERLVACTWGPSTYSLVSNPAHPCMHADPFLPDLDPGQTASIRGKLIFFQGSLQEFTPTIGAR